MNTSLLDIGQEVFVAWANAYGRTRQPCPICFGNLFVVVTLGDGSQQDLACDACRGEYGESTGLVYAYEPESGVIRGLVTGIELTGGVAEYRVNGNSVPTANIFKSHEDADQKRALLFEEAKVSARQSFENQFKRPRSIPWSIRYHRDCIKRAEREIEWHRSKLMATETKVKAKAEREARRAATP